MFPKCHLLSFIQFSFCSYNYNFNMHSSFYLVLQDCGVTSLLAISGLLCKEQGITVLAICCIYELFSQKVRILTHSSHSHYHISCKVLKIIFLQFFIKNKLSFPPGSRKTANVSTCIRTRLCFISVERKTVADSNFSSRFFCFVVFSM